VLRTLAAHQVRFVVIGGYAAVMHGSAMYTADADITPDPDPANLRRLCAALHDVNARLRTVDDPDGIEFSCDEHFLARLNMLHLVTAHGDFDLSFRPAAFSNGYAELVDRAEPFDVGGFMVQVASLDDIIRSKEAAGRAKDHGALPQLYALRDEIAAREHLDDR
jgi:hypothetical protein